MSENIKKYLYQQVEPLAFDGFFQACFIGVKILYLNFINNSIQEVNWFIDLQSFISHLKDVSKGNQ
jgi:hypothetical protein